MASSHFAPMWDRTTMLKIIDNEHQSLCVTTGSRTASSNPTTILSTTAARLGTSSSTNHGASCPSDCANGPTGSDQWDLVLLLSQTKSTHPDVRGHLGGANVDPAG